MTILAIIPARGGSKGIPQKNLVDLAGEPLLGHTLRHAQDSVLVDRVIVSTDDDEIAAFAESRGAEVIDRPAELSGDEASSESALEHVLQVLEDRGEPPPELVVFLQATSPIRPAGVIDMAIRQLQDEGADSVFSATPVHGFLWQGSASEVEPVGYDPAVRPRRQDSEAQWFENGSFYVFPPSTLKNSGHRLGHRPSAFPIDPISGLQIDTEEDLALVERLMEKVSHRPLPRLGTIRLLVLDFDGVLTDNRVIVDQEGREAVICSRGDGLGIEMVRDRGVEIVVLSKERNPVVSARCMKLGIRCHQGQDEKLGTLQALARERGIDREHVAYVGNDVNDLDCMNWVGTSIAVADAEPVVLAAADHITRRRGGFGAVREVCDRILDGLASVEGP